MKATLTFSILFLIISSSSSIHGAFNNNSFPVPLAPGGRMSVHGWLILLIETDTQPNASIPIEAYFVHHTPEFPTDSPHDFQIIIRGSLLPISTTQNITYPIDLPYPPKAELLGTEYTTTPPPNFSLNDLLLGTITQLNGVVFNGSFDTPYERIPISLGSFFIESFPTAVYLDNSSSIEPYVFLQYYSYPRNNKIVTQGIQHYYLSHDIHAAPDFDQVVHVTIDLDNCICENCAKKINHAPSHADGYGLHQEHDLLIADMYEWIHEPGAVWNFPGLPNTLHSRLLAPQVHKAQLLSSPEPTNVWCTLKVLEEIHCVIGPMFYIICADANLPSSELPHTMPLM